MEHVQTGAAVSASAIPSYYGDVVYNADRDAMVRALARSIRIGAILSYRDLESEAGYHGEVIQVVSTPATNQNRIFFEWRVIRLDADGKRLTDKSTGDAAIDKVYPITLLELVRAAAVRNGPTQEAPPLIFGPARPGRKTGTS